MSSTDYLINGLLVALVALQIRGRRITTRALLLPVVIVVFVGDSYLRSIPTGGNDLLLELGGGALGLVLGVGCALATTLSRRADGVAHAKAGLLAATLWVLGIGARIAFSLYATHGGGEAIGRFSAAHHLTSAQAWVVCLVLMSLAEVLSRTSVLALRLRRLTSGGPLSPPSSSTRRSAIMDLRGSSF